MSVADFRSRVNDVKRLSSSCFKPQLSKLRFKFGGGGGWCAAAPPECALYPILVVHLWPVLKCTILNFSSLTECHGRCQLVWKIIQDRYYTRLQSDTGMEEPKYWQKNLSQCHSV